MFRPGTDTRMIMIMIMIMVMLMLITTKVLITMVTVATVVTMVVVGGGDCGDGVSEESMMLTVDGGASMMMITVI